MLGFGVGFLVFYVSCPLMLILDKVSSQPVDVVITSWVSVGLAFGVGISVQIGMSLIVRSALSQYHNK